MNVLVTGSTGFIGSALVPFLESEGHTVTRLVRREPSPGKPEVRWDPEAGTIDAGGLAGTEAVVHLAGESLVNGRWNARRKGRILDSRVKGTRLLSETLARLDPLPKVLVSPSTKDRYGDRGDELLREDSGRGSDFLADVIRQWEAATESAAQAGIRVVNSCFGMVLDRSGGGLARMLLPFRLGLGGRLGSGKQYVSWVSLADTVSAVHHALVTETLDGPVHVVAPGTVTNAEFTRVLGRVLRRPAPWWVPAFALRMMYGEVAYVLLASARLDPGKLLASGFEFRHPELEGALRAALGR